MKLQQAYFSESNVAGGWTLIGYTAPGTNGSTTNFDYDKGAIEVQSSDEVASDKIGWQAHNKANLNDCTSTASTYPWTVTLKKDATHNDVTFDAAVAGAGCVALTPTFDKIGK